jgi:hypothetical protein
VLEDREIIRLPWRGECGRAAVGLRTTVEVASSGDRYLYVVPVVLVNQARFRATHHCATSRHPCGKIFEESNRQKAPLCGLVKKAAHERPQLTTQIAPLIPDTAVPRAALCTLHWGQQPAGRRCRCRCRCRAAVTRGGWRLVKSEEAMNH